MNCFRSTFLQRFARLFGGYKMRVHSTVLSLIDHDDPADEEIKHLERSKPNENETAI